MNFSNIVKQNPQVKDIIKEVKLDKVEVPVIHEEPIESKWSSYYSFNIIDLFSEIKYDFN